jgi:hypothetical protein
MGEVTSGAYGGAELFGWLSEFASHETRRAEHYNLTVDLDPAAGRVDVEGVIRLAEISPVSPGEARFLLHPGLHLDSASGLEASPTRDEGTDPLRHAGALRAVTLPPGASELRLRYGGHLPEAWVSPENTELALYCLWFPLFSGSLPPFTFRVVLKAPPTVIPVMSGKLAPLPPELAPRVHDDEGPRTYLWESAVPANDIALCAGPYLVHQRLHGDLLAEAYVLPDDYDLGERYVDLMGRVLEILSPWFGPIGAVTGSGPYRLAVAVPPRSNWGGYSRPNLIVAPRPLSAGLRDPNRATTVAAFLAHEMGHVWFGTGVRSDTVNEPWLSEAFAEFARLIYVRAELGEERYRRFIERYTHEVSSVGDPKPMRLVATAHPEMDPLARRRGALMLAELRETLGDALMARLLSGFAARHAGLHVRAEEFVQEASALAGRDLGGFFASYLDEPPAPGRPDRAPRNHVAREGPSG